MHLIGLTGGIASGKSTVSKMLTQLGAFIVDADKISREVVMPGKPVWQKIVDRFGTTIANQQGEIDRKQLGKIIFSDSKAKADLEKITHPYIEESANLAIADAEKRGYDTIVLDAPLLIEVGWHTKVDVVWVVFVDEQTQRNRLMARDNISCEDAAVRINAQLALRQKLRYADVVIDNTENIEKTHQQVIQAWQKLHDKVDLASDGVLTPPEG
ncbi:Dephospho-CoA kinase [Sporomusa rhizae]|uniref:dephospho-CoA kinase n=1 Tax=Sporomusa rhizae TaxID=357999 RepID=UPI00352B1532